MMREIHAPTESVAKAHCEEIGNMVVCLHYLLHQAQKSQAPEVVKIINNALGQAMSLGATSYQEYLKESQGDTANAGAFLDAFCRINDEAVKFELRGIALEKELERAV